jgi:hypothetical protein
LEEITQQRIPNAALLNYELWALKKMSWKLNARTTAAFLTCYHELSLIRPYDSTTATVSSSTLLSAALTLATKTMLDVRFKPLQSSTVACAIVYYLRRKNNMSPVWTADLTVMTFHDPTASKMVVQAIALLVDMEAWGDLTAWELVSCPQESEEEGEEDEHVMLRSPVKTTSSVLQELSTPVLVKGLLAENSPVSIAALADL